MLSIVLVYKLNQDTSVRKRNAAHTKVRPIHGPMGEGYGPKTRRPFPTLPKCPSTRYLSKTITTIPNRIPYIGAITMDLDYGPSGI